MMAKSLIYKSATAARIAPTNKAPLLCTMEAPLMGSEGPGAILPGPILAGDIAGALMGLFDGPLMGAILGPMPDGVIAGAIEGPIMGAPMGAPVGAAEGAAGFKLLGTSTLSIWKKL
jgi:hypothetical protein